MNLPTRKLIRFTVDRLEGFLMVSLPNFRRDCSGDFQKIADAFLCRDGLPFADLVSAERICEVFDRHGNLIGLGGVYSTAVMIWSFLGQVIRDGKEASVSRRSRES